MMKISWYGNASLKIESDDTQILIDPFVPMAPSTIPVTINDFYGVDNILVTHGHFDHIENIPEIVQGTDTKIYATVTPANTLMAEGIKKESIKIIKKDDHFDIGSISVTAYQTKHVKIDYFQALTLPRIKRILLYFGQAFSILGKNRLKKENGEILGFMLESDKRRVFVLGSLGLCDDITYPSGVDLLILPYQGSRKIYEISQKIIERIKPKAILLDHFDDAFPPITSDVDVQSLIDKYKGKLPVLVVPYKTPISV